MTTAPANRLLPDLGARIWLLVLVNCMANTGSGLILPFLIVYLHNARGIPLDHAGLLLAIIGAAGIAATPLAGVLADRIGARLTFATGELLFMVATAAFIPVTSFTQAIAPALASGVAGGLTWSGLYVMLGEGVPSARRSDAFGISYALANVGVGIGALIGGFVIDAASPHSFVYLFVGDAISNLLFAAVLFAMSDAPAEAVAPTAPSARDPMRAPLRGYRNVLGDRGLLAVLLVNTLLVTLATSQMTSGFPAWVTGPARSTPRVVGAAFAANTVTLVVAQLFVLRLIRSRRRTDAAAVGALAFALAWLLALAGGHTGGGTTAAVALIGALVVIAIGESLVAPTLPAIVNDLAPTAVRGRYNAVFTLSWQVGPVIGPALAGLLLGESRGNELLLFLAAGCLAVAAIVPSLRRWVPEKADIATSAWFPPRQTRDASQFPSR
ncbi:MAG TPA: MFS transporter [Chloroflexota bacterium]|nr:MFS transporter [Chloroflexota bacterium]